MRRTWADIIQQLMNEAGISQRELATRSGVGRSAVRRLLANSDGTLSVVEKVLHVLGHDLDALPREVHDAHNKTPVIELQPPNPPRRRNRLVDHTVKSVVRYGIREQ